MSTREKAGEPEQFLIDDERQLIASNHWRPDSADLDLILAPHDNRIESFANLLFQLAAMPTGRIRTLSLVGYARQMSMSFSFWYESVFDKELGQWYPGEAQRVDAEPPFSLSIRMDDIINPGAELDVTGNWSSVKLANVRKAFASNAQLRIFNLAYGVSRSFIQVIADFFQVQTVAFLYPVVVFAKEIGLSDRTPPDLLKSYTFATGADPSPDHAVARLEDLLNEPSAFLASPQRS